MGVDCRILVPWNLAWTGWQGGLAYIGSILELPRNEEAFSALSQLKSAPLPGFLWEGQLVYDRKKDTYHEHPVKSDRYSCELRLYPAHKIAETLLAFSEEGDYLQPAIKFLQALPQSATVVLFWS